MSSQWFVKRGDKARGPFTAERLKELAAEGKLKPTDDVREGESGEWVEASQLDWLFPSEVAGEDDPAADEPPTPSQKRPARSSGSPVAKAKEFYQKNPQKALILGGSILASVMLMGMCVCAGFASLIGSGGGDTLTEDYYPHKPDAMATYEVVMLASETSGEVIEYSYIFHANGRTDRRVNRIGTFQNGHVKWTARDTSSATIQKINRESPIIRWRKSQEFIEEGDGDGQWSPLIKLNAKPGEKWESKPVAGMVERYTLLKFDRCDVDGGTRSCAVIREELILDGKPNTDSEITYAKGIGLYSKQVYDVSGGGRKLVSRWRLVEVPKDQRIPAQDAFYK